MEDDKNKVSKVHKKKLFAYSFTVTDHDMRMHIALGSWVKSERESYVRAIEYEFIDYNTIRPHSSTNYPWLDEFERRWNESEEFRNEFLKKEKNTEERKLENRIEKRKSLKENASYEDEISVQN